MSTNAQKLTYIKKNRDAILQRSKDYYENNKEKRKEYRRNKYNNMTDEEKQKVNEYHKEWYRKLNIEKKNKTKENLRNRYHAIKVC